MARGYVAPAIDDKETEVAAFSSPSAGLVHPFARFFSVRPWPNWPWQPGEAFHDADDASKVSYLGQPRSGAGLMWELGLYSAERASRDLEGSSEHSRP